MQCVKMPSIGKLKDVAHTIIKKSQYVGKDEEGNPIFDESKKAPTVKFLGTVKLHGTNGSVCKNYENGELWAQSKKNVITPEKDNAGFAFHVHSNKEKFEKILDSIKEMIPEAKEICLYGEWAGKGIQKKVAISEIPKTFFMFGVKYTVDGETYEWMDVDSFKKIFNYPEINVYNIYNFPTYEIEIDFEDVSKSLESIERCVLEVENECPVAKAFGVSGIGEGVVFVGYCCGERFVFKAKGEKHSNTKVKKLEKVDSGKMKKIIEFANYATPAWRLEQMYQETFDTLNGGKGDIKRTGDFIKAVIADVVKEEMDEMAKRGLELKDVRSHISKIASKWFMEQLDREAGIRK